MEDNMNKRADGNDILSEAAAQSRSLNDSPNADETIVFRREPVKAPMPQGQNAASGRKSDVDMAHTAQIRGGAVVRPLKQQQTPPPARQSANGVQRQVPPNPRQQAAQMPVQRQNPSAGQQRPQQTPKPQQTPARTQSPAQSQRPMQQPAPNYRQPTPQQSQVPPTQRPQAPTQRQTVPQNQPTQRQTAQQQNQPIQRQTAQNGVQRPVTAPAPRQSQQQNASRQNNLPVRAPQPYVRSENDDFEIDEAATREHGRRRRRGRESGAADSATSAVMSLVKAVIYIVVIIVISAVLSVFVINTANDIFKFVTDDEIVTVDIPEYATIDDVADALYDAGAIKYKWAFKLWSGLKDSGAEFIPGTYEISTTLNYDYLRAAFKASTKRTEIRVTIPEGYTVDEMIELFVEKGIGTKNAFIKVINEYDFDYRFLDALTVSEDRIYRLEGYLFPDTYNFYLDSNPPDDPDDITSEVTAIAKLLDNFNIKFADEYYDRCTDLGLTVDEAIILASMIEKETRYADELGDVSSVFHNRLKYSASFPYLNSDATIMYAIAHDTGSRLETMTGEDTSYETPYNTYTHRGLPPGPIANPGLNAIKYALYPNDTNYFFFVSDSSGRTLFATTQAEHDANIRTVRAN